MQPWQYLFVTFEVRQPSPASEPDWYLTYASDQKVSPQTAPTIHAYTNQRGAEGWQLFSSHYAFKHDKPTLLRLIFRRPVEPPTPEPGGERTPDQPWKQRFW
jgi:hypothetical protein